LKQSGKGNTGIPETRKKKNEMNLRSRRFGNQKYLRAKKKKNLEKGSKSIAGGGRGTLERDCRQGKTKGKGAKKEGHEFTSHVAGDIPQGRGARAGGRKSLEKNQVGYQEGRGENSGGGKGKTPKLLTGRERKTKGSTMEPRRESL